MLRADRIPFLLATLLAFLSWTLTRAVDRAVETAIIKQSVSKSADGSVTTFDMRNISSQLLKDVRITVFLVGQGRLGEARPLEPQLPMVLDQTQLTPGTDQTAAYHLSAIQPGAHFLIRVHVTGPGSPKLGLTSATPVRLSDPTFQTFMVEHELAILLGLAFLVTLLAGGYFWAVTRPVKTDEICV